VKTTKIDGIDIGEPATKADIIFFIIIGILTIIGELAFIFIIGPAYFT
jgi:hypothetical protein